MFDLLHFQVLYAHKFVSQLLQIIINFFFWNLILLALFVGSGTQVQELSTAALGYHKVVKENRKLYNMVQDLKGR